MTRNTDRSARPNLIESLETRQMLAADLPEPFRPPIIFDRGDRIMVFGIALSMAKSFPSNLATRFNAAVAERASVPGATAQTSPGRETDSPENNAPAGDAPVLRIAAPVPETVETFKLIDTSQKDGDVVDSAKVVTRPTEAINLSADQRPQRTMPLDRDVLVGSMQPVSTSPFAAIDNAIASALAGNTSDVDFVTVNTFGMEQRTTKTSLKTSEAVTEETVAAENETGPAHSLPLAIIAPDTAAQPSLWRNLLASATVVFAVIGNWYLRRTRKRSVLPGRKMIEVPSR